MSVNPLLVADLFCGAGGSSTGAERAIKALGLEMILVCVNHWPVAIETHRKNHPTARHYIEDLSVAKPTKIVPEGYLDLLMASPECTHFSRARGGKPVNDQSRMNPWAVIRWLTDLDVRCLLVENVPEFIYWGPIDKEGRPVPEKKSTYFEAWIRTIWELGYTVDWKFLNAADYGDATTRRRFFLIARKDGAPIRWPEPTHSKTGESTLYDCLPRWRSAREIINWNEKGRSILDDPKYKKRPLSINTRKRIARGLEKYGGVFASMYINLLGLDYDGVNEGEPKPFIIQSRKNAKARSMEEPISTVTASNGGGGICHVQPTFKPFVLGQQSCGAPRPVDEPIPTITSNGYIGMIEPQLVVFHGQSETKPVNEPVPSILTNGHIGLIEPQLVSYYGNSYKDTDVRSVDEPTPTVTTKARLGLVEPTAKPFIVQNRLYFGKKGDPTRAPHSIDNPLPAVTGHGAGAIVEPVMVHPIITGGPSKDIDPRRFVSIDGVLHILDIRFRMLSNRELARAMGFDDKELEYEFVGNISEVTKQIGNAVPVNLAAALVGTIIS